MTWQSEILLSAALTRSSFFAEDKIPLEIVNRYPELRGIFERYEDVCVELQEAPDQEEYNNMAAREYRLEGAVCEAEERFAQIRDMVDTLLKMDAAEPLRSELAQLSSLADEAFTYMRKCDN